MPDPSVVCVMLTRDREEMARRAVECFRAQTYERKRLLIVNSGPCPILTEEENDVDGISEPCFVGIDGMTIGELRNHACKYASAHYAESWTRPEIFVTMDDDDYSHPNRIAEQVGLLESSGADVVGYREALFWRTPARIPVRPLEEPMPEYFDIKSGEAWLYYTPSPAYAIGGSLCYWRKTWERKPFPDAPKRNAAGELGSAEDVLWMRGLKVCGVGSIGECQCHEPAKNHTPRFIGRIHGGNTMPYNVEENPDSWRRVPEWDEYCRGVFA